MMRFLGNHTIAVWIGENVDDLSKMTSDSRVYMMLCPQCRIVLRTLCARCSERSLNVQ